MGYNKSLKWYLTKEYKPIAKKMENRINKKGSPRVKVKIVKGEFFIDAPDYAKFQDMGVKGASGGRTNSKRNYGREFKYTDKMPPPSAFERYTSDPGEQFAIAKSIYHKGIPAKKYILATMGFFAPQIKRATDRAVKNYTDNEIMK